MDAATRLIALQGERDYILFRLRDLEKSETGLHPTGEKRRLMHFFEVLNQKIRELTNEVLTADEELGFVVENGKVEEIIEGQVEGGFLCDQKGSILQFNKKGERQKFALIYFKEQDNEET